eukprot:scaffold86803_cov69-Phaeocystis_antarctica.AAC.4
MVTQPLGRVTPIAFLAHAQPPAASMRLVLQVHGKDIPLGAQPVGKLVPRLLDSLLRDDSVKPLSIARPRQRPKPVAGQHDQNTMFSSDLSELNKHVHVAVALQLWALPRSTDAVLCLVRGVERRVGQNSLVVEEEPDGIEAVVCQKSHIPRNVVLVEPKRRSGAVAPFAAEPVDALDVEPSTVGPQKTTFGHEVDLAGW